MFPTRGWYNTLSGEFADTFLLSREHVHPLRGGGARLYPIWGPFVLRAQGERGPRSPAATRAACRSSSATSSAASTTSAASRRARWARSSARSATGRQDSLAAATSWSAATCTSSCNAEIEFPLFDKVGIRGVVFTDMGNAFNLEDQYCASSQPSDVDDQQEPLPRARSTRSAYRAELGLRLPLVLADRPAALRVGHPVQDRCPASSPSSSSSRSATFSKRVKQTPLPEEMHNVTGDTVSGCSGLSAEHVGGLRRGHEARLRRHAARAQRDRGRPQGEGEAQEGLRSEAEGAGRAAGRSSRRTSRTSTRSARCCRPTRSARRKRSCRSRMREGAADLHAPPAGPLRQGAGGDRQDLRAHDQDHRARSPPPRTSA